MNPDGAASMDVETVELSRRFTGPRGYGNGGVLAGLLAQRLGGCVEVTLRKPIPLAQPLAVSGEAPRVAMDPRDASLVAEARRSALSDAPPEPPGLDFVVDPAHPPPQSASDYHDCFVCGMDRAPGDGLRLVARAVAGRRLAAVRWEVSDALPTAEGRVTEPMVWAALDCPGLFSVMPEEPGVQALLGRITAEVDACPRPGDVCLVVGWPLGAERRKRFTGTALYAADGTRLAQARATWITVA